MAKANESYFQIDWFDYKKILKATVLDGNGPTLNNNTTTRSFATHVSDSGSWRGYTDGQLKRWISEGYAPPEMVGGLSNLIPPMREKSRTIWNEDGDEFHVDRAMSGTDNFMSSQSRREVIPGLKIEAGIMFSSATNHTVVNNYTIWLCKVLFSLEQSGIDTQLTLDFPSWESVNDSSRKRAGTSGSTLYHSVVRVKKEGEISDFKSWSTMVSPAALRNFGFGAICLHANEINGTPSGTMGRGVPERSEWKLVWNEERRVLIVENAYTSSSFPESKMTADLKSVMSKVSGKTQ
jgi:hypothetical protein